MLLGIISTFFLLQSTGARSDLSAPKLNVHASTQQPDLSSWEASTLAREREVNAHARDTRTDETTPVEEVIAQLTRSGSKADVVWSVAQQPASCSLVWFNQSSSSISTYRVTSFDGSASCEPGAEVWTGLFETEDVHAFQQVFETVCTWGWDVASRDINLPVYHHMTTTHRNPVVPPLPSMTVPGAAVLMVRNECAGPVTITLQQHASLSVACFTDYFTVSDLMLQLYAGLLLIFALVALTYKLKRRNRSWSENEDVKQSKLYDSESQLEEPTTVSDLAIKYSGDLTQPLVSTSAPSSYRHTVDSPVSNSNLDDTHIL